MEHHPEPEIELATPADVPAVVRMVEEFHTLERLPFDETTARLLLEQLVTNRDLGRLLVFRSGERLAGYMLLGFGFSLEFGGRDALVDELYISPDCRGRGIGAAALEFACSLCRDLRLSALHLEVDHLNHRAHAFYRRIGFVDHERHLMTRWL